MHIQSGISPKVLRTVDPFVSGEVLIRASPMTLGSTYPYTDP